MADTTVNSTLTVQNIAKLNNVATTMDTCQLTVLNPNRTPVIGPVGVAAVSTGVYQFLIGIGKINLPGTWSTVWYTQFSVYSLQTTSTFVAAP